MGLLDRLTGAPANERISTLKVEFDGLFADNHERIARMKAYREEAGSSRPTAIHDASSAASGYSRSGRRNAVEAPARHDIPLPFGRALTIKHAYRMAGQLPEVVVDRRAETPPERFRSDTMEKLVWSVIRASHGDTALADGAWDASELGTAVFDVYYNIKKQTPIFRRLDPVGVMEIQGVEQPHDFQRVYRSWLVPLRSVQAKYRDSNFNGAPAEVANLDSYRDIAGKPYTMLVEVCDPTNRTTFAFGKGGLVGLDDYQHDFGFTPVVIIPNLGPYDNVWGWADYEFIRSLQHYLGQLLSREADVLRAVANGSYIEKGTGQNPDSVKETLASGGVIPAKRDGSVEPIAPPAMPAFANEHADRVMEYFKMLGFAPDAAWGNSGFRSGSAASLQLQPLLEYAGMKQANWTAGLSRLFGMGFQIIEKKLVGTATYKGAKPGITKASPQSPFAFTLSSEAGPLSVPDPDADGDVTGGGGLPPMIDLPQNPKDLFDGDYEVRFRYTPLIDPNDPGYVSSELNKFTSGLQSLETTLERLGYQAPEDEMRRIEQEADRFPWINQGMVQMILAQLKNGQQGQGGGQPPEQDFGAASDMMAGDGGGATSGALNADAMTGALPNGTGPLYGGA